MESVRSWRRLRRRFAVVAELRDWRESAPCQFVPARIYLLDRANRAKVGRQPDRLKPVLLRQIPGEHHLRLARVGAANLADAVVFFAAALQLGFEAGVMFERND